MALTTKKTMGGTKREINIQREARGYTKVNGYSSAGITCYPSPPKVMPLPTLVYR